jgi:hypothetical protein
MVGTLITLAVSGCGPGSRLVGIPMNGGTGGTGSGVGPVLSFFAEPGSANVGQAISTVEVLARDSLGAPDSAFTGTISIALSSDSTGAGLSGTTSMRPVNGVATFANLAVDKAGTYTLTASTSGATDVTSTPFSITTVLGP